MRNRKFIQILAICMAMTMVFLTACGNANNEAIATMAPINNTKESKVESQKAKYAEMGRAIADAIKAGADILNEIPAGLEESDEVIPYFEENELEFSEDLTIPVKGVRLELNDNSVYEEVDSECVITDVSIEEAENGFKTITVKYEVTGELYDSYKKRFLQAVMPNVAYCDLNTGKFYDIDTGILYDSEDMSEITIEWDGRIYDIEQTSIVEWSPEPNWKPDGKNGYVGPVTMYVTDSFVVPEDYDGMGMAIGIFTTEELYSGKLEMFVDTPPFILEVLEKREGVRLYSINELCELFSEDETVADDADTKVDTDKSSTASANNGNSKENTNNSSSKDNTAPKQAQTAHTHSYTSSVTKNPSCGENGVKTYTCSCGSSYTEAIPATGHQWTTTTETVSHPSTGHYETVTRKEIFCGCGASGFQSMDEYKAHVRNNHCGGTCGVVEYTDNVWVVDSEEYTETINITKCIVCGVQG